MANSDPNDLMQRHLHHRSETQEQLIKYLILFKQKWFFVASIVVISLLVTFLYLKYSDRVYQSITTVKIETAESNVLQGNLGNETFMGRNSIIPNIIQLLQSYEMRNRVAEALLDSFKTAKDKNIFEHLLKFPEEDRKTPLGIAGLRRKLGLIVKIDQKENLNIITISSEGLSFPETSLITNAYANEFKEYSNESKMEDLSTLKKFLNSEREKKLAELNDIEVEIGDFQKQNGFTDIAAYNMYLTESIRSAEEAIRQGKLNLKTNAQSISALQKELADFDSTLVNYVKLQINEASLMEVQKSINTLEIQRDIDLSNAKNEDEKKLVLAGYDEKLKTLTKIRDDQSRIVLENLSSNTPVEKKDIVRRLFDLNLQRVTIASTIEEYTRESALNKQKLNNLPELGLELAKLERKKETNEKLYTQLEEKYQETEIRERTRLSDVSILDPGLDNSSPIRPNKTTIVLMGVFFAIGLSFIYLFLVNFLDDSIKEPGELEKKGINVLSWIPNIPELNDVNLKNDFIVSLKPKSTASEAFKALRTRIHYSRPDAGTPHTVLVTSSLPSEGKTLVSVNLAGSFAQADKKTLLIDCDLRKPRLHHIFNTTKTPGLSEMLFEEKNYEDVVKNTDQKKLDLIVSGTIPSNPSELLGSNKMKDFIEKMKEIYDIIILDSPPFISVTDAEILFNVADGTVLVAKAEVTPMEVYIDAYSRMYELSADKLLGCVLNDFDSRRSYGYYYSYYYYYRKHDEQNS